MKHLKLFSLLESEGFNNLTQEQEDFLNSYTKGSWSVNPATGLVDVQGSFNCYGRRLESLAGILFGTVTRDFVCGANQLTSLVGAPQMVKGGFNCASNRLTSLEGAPQTVGGSFYCDENFLTSLVGAPETVGVIFFCGHNSLTSLAGAPQTVGKYFWCDDFELDPGQWNPTGWFEVLRTGSPEARELILTLPYLQPQYWLDLHRSDRQKFNALWLQYRRDPEIRSTPLWQQVEQALSGRAQSNLDDLEMLRDFT